MATTSPNSLRNNLVPSVQDPLVNPDGTVSVTWAQFFAQLVGQPQPIAPVAIGKSPFSFTASQKGTISVTGGTVSATQLTRARVTINVLSQLIPMAQGDTIVLTYTVAPSLNFIPG